MPGMSQSRLRGYIRKCNEDLFASLQYLWSVCGELHDQQNQANLTEHGRLHVEHVEENVWRLIQQSKGMAKGDFLPEELFVLSAASCCHDFGKALDEYDARSGAHEVMHGSGSAEFVMRNYRALGLSEKKELAHHISEVCNASSLYGADFTNAIKRLPKAIETPGGSIRMQRAAAILKAADILHNDESRISKTFSSTYSTELDRSKYMARKCIRGWRVDGDRLVIEADADDNQHLKAVEACRDYMVKYEWPQVARHLKQYGFPHKLKFNIAMPVSKTGVDAIGQERPKHMLSFRVYMAHSLNKEDDEVVDSLIQFISALSAYHIACGGNGLIIDDWLVSTPISEAMGV